MIFLTNEQIEQVLEMYDKGGRADLSVKESAEVALLEKYLPPGVSEDELQLLRRHPEIGTAFARCCGRREMDDRLVLESGPNRGTYLDQANATPEP